MLAEHPAARAFGTEQRFAAAPREPLSPHSVHRIAAGLAARLDQAQRSRRTQVAPYRRCPRSTINGGRQTPRCAVQVAQGDRGASTKKRRAAVDSNNCKTSVRPINFTEGDYVLRSVLQSERGRKPSLPWKGPYRATACRSDYILEIEDLLSGQKQDAHGRRLKFFCNKDIEVIETFEDIRRRAGTMQLLVRWKGFGDTEQDWVDLSTLREDVPVLVEEYLKDIVKTSTQRQRRLASNI